MGEVSCANAERALTPVSLCARDRLTNIRPRRLVACFCLPANLISRIARALISFCPVSQSHIDFLERHVGVRMKGSRWNAPAITLLCLSATAWSSLLGSINSFGFTWFAELKEVDQIGKIESSLLYAHVLFCFGFVWFFSSPNSCLHLSHSSLRHLLFPLLHPLSSCACSVCLCVPKTADMSLQAWVSETLMSVWRSLRYISRPLPCIIDSPSLITVSTVTDEPLLPAACARWVAWVPLTNTRLLHQLQQHPESTPARKHVEFFWFLPVIVS